MDYIPKTVKGEGRMEGRIGEGQSHKEEEM